MTEQDRLPLMKQLPESGDGIAPSIPSLVDQIREYHDSLALDFISLEPPALDATKAAAASRQAATTCRTIAVIADRLDPDVSDRLHALADKIDFNRRNLDYFASGRGREERGEVATNASEAADHTSTAMALTEGLMVASLIDGPARGSSTLNIINTAHAGAVAAAQATSTVTADMRSLADEVRSSNEYPDEIADDLDVLGDAVDAGEPGPSLLVRLGQVMEKAQPHVNLAGQIAKLAARLLG